MGIQVGKQLQSVMVPGSQIWDHMFGTVSFMWNLCSVLEDWVMVDEFWHPIFKWAALPCTLWWVTRMIIPVHGDMLFNKRFIEQVYQIFKERCKIANIFENDFQNVWSKILCIDEMGLIMWFLSLYFRIYFAAARDGLFPSVMSMISLHYKTPLPSVLVTVSFTLNFDIFIIRILQNTSN